MGVGGEIQQNVFTHIGREIDQLRTGQLMMDRERGHFDIESEWLEAAHAFQFDRLDKMAGYPKRAFRNPEVQRITQRSHTNDIFRRQIGNRTFFFAFEVQTVGLDLAEMDFHWKMTKHE